MGHSQYKEMDDAELIHRIANGDEEALKRLIKLYKDRVFLYVYGLLQNYEDSEEVTVETFYQIWRSARNFKGYSKVSTWIFGIARNLVMKTLRRKKRELLVFSLEDREDSVSDEEVSLPEHAEILKMALEKLSPAQREVMHLAFYEELPYSEIAKIMGIPESTVKTRVFYAKKKLKEIVKELLDESQGSF